MEAPKSSQGEVRDGFLEEVASKSRSKKYRGCHGEGDTVPAFMEFYCVNKYIGINHIVCQVFVGVSVNPEEHRSGALTPWGALPGWGVSTSFHPVSRELRLGEMQLGDTAWRQTIAEETKELIPDSGDIQSSYLPITLASFSCKCYCTNIQSFSSFPVHQNCQGVFVFKKRMFGFPPN